MENIKLIEVKTKHFKGLGDFSYKPKSEGVNIIYGDNGVGKSSLIKIFNFFTAVTNNLRLRNNQQQMGINIDPSLSAPALTNPYLTFSEINTDDGISEPIEFELTLQMDEDFYKYGFILNSQNHLTKEYFIKLKKTDKTDKKILFEKKVYDSFVMDDEIFKNINISKTEMHQENLNSIIALIDLVLSNQNITEEIMLNAKYNENPIVMLSKAITILNVANNDWYNEETYLRTIISLPRIQMHSLDISAKEKFYEEVEDFEDFVMAIDKKINGVEVREQLSPDKRLLELYIVLIIKVDGKRVEVPFELMSSGTQDYLKYFRMVYLLNKKIWGTVSSSVILFDEFGIHLHPSLAIKILNYINDLSEKNGSQIILTSHQAVLLDKKLTNLSNKNKNIMIRDENGSTFVKSLTNTGSRENHLGRYIRGFYGGNDLNSLSEEEDG